MKNDYLIIYSLTFLFAISVFSTIGQTQVTRPNIVLILADDLGYGDVGFNRGPTFPVEYGVIPTPQLDVLADNGMIFTAAHVAHPFCGPSRAALMTGIYPHRIGAQYNLPNDINTPYGISTAETFFSNVLQDANYYTAMVGKWHLGHAEGFDPNSRGFDDFLGFLGGGHNYFESSYEDAFYRREGTTNPVTNEYQVPLNRNQNYVDKDDYTQDQYLTHILTDEAVGFINSAPANKPFFLYVSYNAPHTPLQAPEIDITQFKVDNPNFETLVANSPDVLSAKAPDNWPGTDEEFRKSLIQDRLTYATMVTIMDQGIGDIKSALSNKGILDNTLIVFLSDNGGKLRQSGAVNYPLIQGKGSVDEGGHRVPMLMHWPGKIPAGQSYDHLVSALDLYPTFINVAGATLPEGKLLDGKDILPHILANTNGRDTEPLYVMRPLGDEASGNDGFQNVSIKLDNWKIIKKANSDWQLYNMSNDIEEANNLANSTTDPDGQGIIAQLISKAVEWVKVFKDEKPGWFDLYDHQHASMWDDGRLPAYDTTFGSNELLLESEKSSINIQGVKDAIEGEANGLFSVSLPDGILASEDINITYTAAGDATEGIDYTTLSGNLTILSGTNSSDIIIEALLDDLEEFSETVIITLQSTSLGSLGIASASIIISDAVPPTLLTAGDVAIVGFKAASGNIGAVAFILLKDINASTKISFSNRSWKSSQDGWTGNYGIDDIWTWTSGVSLPAGTILKLDYDGQIKQAIGDVEMIVGSTVHNFSGRDDDNFNLSPSGDTVLIYQVYGDFSEPTTGTDIGWITGLNTNATGWAMGGGNSFSAIPTALIGFTIDATNGINEDQDYGVYTGALLGNISQLRDSINNSNNWMTSETTIFNLWSFMETVEGISGNIGTEGTLDLLKTSKLNLNIYPNPSHKDFNLKFGKSYNNIEVEVFSITGKFIKKINLNTPDFILRGTNLPSGMYILKIKADKNFVIEKVIKI